MTRFPYVLLALAAMSAPALGQNTSFTNFITGAPTATTPFGPSDLVPVIQGGVTKKYDISTITPGMLSDAANAVVPNARTNLGLGTTADVAFGTLELSTGSLQIDTTGLPAKSFTFADGNSSVTYPVPTFRPVNADSLIAFDMFPGVDAVEQAGSGFTWAHFCNSPNNAKNCAYMGIRSDGAVFGNRAFSGATQLPTLLANGTTTIAKLITVGGVGFVGINTAGDPAAELDVFSAASPEFRLGFSDNTSFAFMQMREGSTQLSAIRTMGSAFATADRQGDLEIVSNTADITFWPSNTHLMTIKGTTGWVNIGGAGDPTSELTVAAAVSPEINVTWTTTTSFGRYFLLEGATEIGGLRGIGSAFATPARQSDLEVVSTAADISFWPHGAQQMIIKKDSGWVNMGGAGDPTSELTITATGSPAVDLTFSDTTSFARYVVLEGVSEIGGVRGIGSTFATAARRSGMEIFAAADVSLWPAGVQKFTAKADGTITFGDAAYANCTTLKTVSGVLTCVP